MFGKISDTYSELWRMIIRPPREKYTQEDLGPARFSVGGRVCRREDLVIHNPRGLKLQCSHFTAEADDGNRPPCVIYLHGNCSSRLEAFDALEVLLALHISVFCLDLSGSGLSEGEYISLGHHEQEDVRSAVEYLRNSGTVGPIALWGRSMGAATTVLTASRDASLTACVMDSPFASLRTVAEELVGNGKVPVPRFLLNMALGAVASEVESRAGFEIDLLQPVKAAPYATSPALFATAVDDTFILPHHAEDIYRAWGGEKRLLRFTGGHNGQRPEEFLNEAAAFLSKHLRTAKREPRLRPVRSARTARDGAQSSTPRGPGTPSVSPTKDPRSSSRTQGHIPDPSLRPKEAYGGYLDPFATGDLSPAQPRGPYPASGPMHPGGGADVASQLRAMGVSQDAAAEAERRHSSVEAALQWIAKQSMQSVNALGTTELRAPSTMTNLRTPSMDGPPDRRSPTAATMAPPSPEEMVADLVQQLARLGVMPDHAEEAARRHSSVEAAVDWLIDRGQI